MLHATERPSMKIYAVIPARYDSTRFPGKPLAPLAGKPMIQWVVERTRETPELDDVLVATDDERIAGCVRSFGGRAILTRTDHASGTDRLAEAAQRAGFQDDDLLVNVQGDEPLVEPSMIRALVTALTETEAFPMATLAVESEAHQDFFNPNAVKVVMDRSGRALYFSRSPIPYRRDGDPRPARFFKHLGFYAYRKRFLLQFTQLPPGILERTEKLEQLRALEYGYPIRVAISPVETHGVDTPEDLERLERFLNRR